MKIEDLHPGTFVREGRWRGVVTSIQPMSTPTLLGSPQFEVSVDWGSRVGKPADIRPYRALWEDFELDETGLDVMLRLLP